MKKFTRICTVLAITALASSHLHAAKTVNKTELPKTHADAKHTEHLDVVAFWHKAVELFKKAGYGPDTAFGKHAQHNMERVETMHKAFGKHTATQEAHAKKALGRKAKAK